ncbi:MULTISPECIES: peptidoglycan glycosyltransferase PbpC [Providencia]|uniref:peptidoglycan glycosyltransferase n=1 Tax=Providencia huaxiensis TaxID=2027290 RepID=A0ABU2IX34_9GAMM|nr:MULTISPECIES: peptidoglycan glycosyltransferase PbpC [Providencia]MBZ3680158.1 peptidoglycan glycosyltransferase PbpC [Providencia rettgeri]AXH60910.1 peptidoglycan glycosyltransferase PbpC [Providencia huaxiensis]MDT0133210.1 peptidoglycan glycosyltransferase PbpC [Providencia huaxiensis]MDT1979616.1 peptidoglycan glycosyltransferase PbpC [Providencia huaxiensis]QLR02637.1 peptidoglycan glycosyltransferase PbpC [Providencia rettgeri]
MKKWLRRTGITLVLLVIILPLAFLAADKIWPLPIKQIEMARTVVAADGTPLWRFADKEGIWRFPVTLEEVSPDFIEALLTYEDRHFYRHPGVNPFSLVRAAGQFVSSGRIVSGGSTISMQVARLIDPHERTLGGKLKQLWRTAQLEYHYSKDEILGMYLNRAPYGGTIEGIGAASWVYLNKSPAKLTASEAALFAVLPQAPSRLRPDRYPERAQAARDKVLDRLEEYLVWSPEKVTDIKQEQIWLAPRKNPHSAPLLARRVTKGTQESIIETTIDASLQRQLEDMAMNWKNQLPKQTSLGILVVDHTDMAVKAYIGSIDFQDDSRFGHVDMVSAWRSPGSTLKPFLYALAMDDGLIHAESLLQDVPRRFNDYRPGNFDSGFNGPVSVSDALVRSLNLPVVQLLDVYGSKRFTAQLRNVGTELRFPLGSEPNLSLILGGTATRMEDLVSAYSAFARKGNVSPLRFKPTDEIRDRALMSPGAAWIVRRIMGGEARPVPDPNLSGQINLAWKTGTSYGYRDAWAIGVNPRYTIGVWVGRPDATPVAGQLGFATAIPIMNQINGMLLSKIYQSHEPLPKDVKPASVSQAVICWPGGTALLKDDNNCRQRRLSWILDNTIPPTLMARDQESLLGLRQKIWVNEKGLQVAADCPNAQEKEVHLWPITVESWLPNSEKRENRLPKADSVCPPMKLEMPPLLISGIRDGEVLQRLPGKTSLDLRLVTQGGQGQKWWFLNGEQVNTTEQNGSILLTLDKSGSYQISVLDLSGQVTAISFRVK